MGEKGTARSWPQTPAIQPILVARREQDGRVSMQVRPEARVAFSHVAERKGRRLLSTSQAVRQPVPRGATIVRRVEPGDAGDHGVVGDDSPLPGRLMVPCLQDGTRLGELF